MEPETVLVLACTVAVPLLIALTALLFPSYMRAKIRALAKDLMEEVSDLTDEVPQLIFQLRAERARAAGTIATAQRRGAIPRDDQDEEEEGRGGLSPMLLGLATQLGIDPSKVMAGDPAELAKVTQALGALKQQGPQNGGLSSRDLL